MEPDPTPDGSPAEGGVALDPGEVRRLRWRTLTLLWCAVSVGAVLLWVREPTWLSGAGGWARVRAVRLEQWVALGLLALHAVFAWSWARSRRRPAAGGA